MPTFATSQEWLEQSTLLLRARPTTTRITTKYAIKRVEWRENKKAALVAAGQEAAPKPPRGVLVLKTYDPVSGVTLKYRTTKAAEVSRLVHALGRLGRDMAALPPEADESLPDAPEAAETKAEGPAEAARAGAASASAPAPAQQATQQAGGGKKKKKGKK